MISLLFENDKISTLGHSKRALLVLLFQGEAAYRFFRNELRSENPSMRVAFLGLGIMGRPMAANLVKAGHEVAVWNRTPKQVEGARPAESPADAANGAEVVWMC